VMPFVLLAFLIPAARRRQCVVLTFATYFVFMLAWGAARFSFLRHVFSAIPFLYQFRFPARALRIGAFALVLLAGLGLEDVWLRCRALSLRLACPYLERAGRMLLAMGVLVLVGHSVLHLYQTNRALLRLSPLRPEIDEALTWLASYDPSEYAVANDVDTRRQAGSYAHYRHHLRSLNVTLGWTVATVVDGLAPGSVHAAPKYVIVPAGTPVEARGDSPPQLVREIQHLEIWHIPEALPFAFTVPYHRIQERHAPLGTTTEVTEQRTSRPTPNEIEVLVTSAGPGDLLIVLESWFPGWRVSVDRQPWRLLKVDRFLGVYLTSGDHNVTFRYDPLAFMISVGTVCALVAYALSVDKWLLRRSNRLSARYSIGGEGVVQ